jgi:hypothetical protein
MLKLMLFFLIQRDFAVCESQCPSEPGACPEIQGTCPESAGSLFWDIRSSSLASRS